MTFVRWALLWLGLALASPALADSWALPTPETYISPRGTVRATIVPRALTNQLDYFEDKVAGREPAGSAAGSAGQAAMARIERNNGRDYALVRQQLLLNDVAPVLAAVSDDGYLATLDNWHSLGLGDNVLVIYRPNGSVIRSFTLAELLPETYTAGLSRSVSSLHWRGGARLSADQRRLVIDVAMPEEDEDRISSSRYLPLEVDLGSATVLPREATGWDEAEAAALRVVESERKYEEQRLVFHRTPLLAPGSEREQDWHLYLREAFARLDPERCDPTECEDYSSTGTTVLRPPTAKDYRTSEKWLADDLTKPASHPDLTDVRSVGSPDEANLVAVIARLAKNTKRNQLRSVHLTLSSAQLAVSASKIPSPIAGRRSSL